jgi:hypothetical protein
MSKYIFIYSIFHLTNCFDYTEEVDAGVELSLLPQVQLQSQHVELPRCDFGVIQHRLGVHTCITGPLKCLHSGQWDLLHQLSRPSAEAVRKLSAFLEA